MSKNFLIIGFGVTGKAIYNYLIRKYATQPIKINIFDQNPIELENYRHYDHHQIVSYTDINDTFDCTPDSVIVSPGINPLIYQDVLAKNDIKCLSDIDFFIQELRLFNIQSNIFAITGTNGKSTVSALLAHLLTKLPKNYPILAGNYGKPAIECLSDFLDNCILDKSQIDFVLELSSYQLELSKNLDYFSSTCLNITPDHLAWHNGFDNYAKSKLKIYSNSKYDVVNFDDEFVFNKYIKTSKNRTICIYSVDESVILDDITKAVPAGIKEINCLYLSQYKNKRCIFFNNTLITVIDDLPVLFSTKHNLSNLLACMGLLLAKLYDLNFTEDQIIQTLSKIVIYTKDFIGLKHRCELIYSNKLFIYDDSKATNLDATITAINSISKITKGKIFLILGGIVKEDIDIQDCREKFYACLRENSNKINTIIISSANEISEEKFLDLIINYNRLNPDKELEYYSDSNLKNIAENLYNLTVDSDAILFSPGGASFDQYDNYQHRGDVFTELFKQTYSNHQKTVC